LDLNWHGSLALYFDSFSYGGGGSSVQIVILARATKSKQLGVSCCDILGD